MELDMVLNELSLTPPAPNDAIARERLAEFIKALSAATRQGVKRNLRTSSEINTVMLAPGYYLKDWLSDRRVDIDQRRFYRSLTTKYPIAVDLPGMVDAMSKLECVCENHVATGLGLAYEIDGLAVSLLSTISWDAPSLTFEIQEIVGDIIESNPAQVRHTSRPKHVEIHAPWIQQRVNESIQNGADLWERAAALYPSLIFCTEVSHQMHALPAAAVSGIMRGLQALETYCRSWSEGGFNRDTLGASASPESEATLQQFSHCRKFTDPNGRKLVFSWHVKIGQHWRIHFDPATGPSRILVGYVGPHLPTVIFH